LTDEAEIRESLETLLHIEGYCGVHRWARPAKADHRWEDAPSIS